MELPHVNAEVIFEEPGFAENLSKNMARIEAALHQDGDVLIFTAVDISRPSHYVLLRRDGPDLSASVTRTYTLCPIISEPMNRAQPKGYCHEVKATLWQIGQLADFLTKDGRVDLHMPANLVQFSASGTTPWIDRPYNCPPSESERVKALCRMGYVERFVHSIAEIVDASDVAVKKDARAYLAARPAPIPPELRNTAREWLPARSEYCSEWGYKFPEYMLDWGYSIFQNTPLSEKQKRVFAKWLLTGAVEDKHGLAPSMHAFDDWAHTVDFDAFKREYGPMGSYVADWVANNTRNGALVDGVGTPVDITKYTLREAYNESERWHRSLRERAGPLTAETGEVVMTFPDGHYWLDLQTAQSTDEAEMMQHCGRAMGSTLLSLRKGGRPFVTVDYEYETGIVRQIKGKQNKAPVAEYHPYIVELLLGKPYSRARGELLKISKLEYGG